MVRTIPWWWRTHGGAARAATTTMIARASSNKDARRGRLLLLLLVVVALWSLLLFCRIRSTPNTHMMRCLKPLPRPAVCEDSQAPPTPAASRLIGCH